MTDLTETVRALLSNKRFATIRDLFATMNAADIAPILSDQKESDLPLLFRLLSTETAAETFVEMNPDEQEMLIRGFSDTELKAVLSELYLDDAVDIIEEMPGILVPRILKAADPESRKLINELLKYPEDSAGSIMTPEFVSLSPNETVEEAIDEIRRTGLDKETINVCYVARADRTLLGSVSIRRILLSEADDRIGDIADTNVIACETTDDQETVAQMLSKYDLIALPVVDHEKRIVGIVTVDDALDVLQEENTEDIEKMAAITPSDRPYLETSVPSIFLHRIPWLLLLMLTSTMTELIINLFTDKLNLFGAIAGAMLIACIPMLMDTGGNAGGQSSATIIRGLSLGEIEFSDFFRVIGKELTVALMSGAVLAVINFVKMVLVNVVLYHYAGQDLAVYLIASITISLAILLTIVVAKFAGCTLPMLAKKIGFDPAVMAAPFITTMIDVTSLLLLFALANIILMHVR